jgi:hypothetical protein
VTPLPVAGCPVSGTYPGPQRHSHLQVAAEKVGIFFGNTGCYATDHMSAQPQAGIEPMPHFSNVTWAKDRDPYPWARIHEKLSLLNLPLVLCATGQFLHGPMSDPWSHGSPGLTHPMGRAQDMGPRTCGPCSWGHSAGHGSQWPSSHRSHASWFTVSQYPGDTG